MMDQPMNQPPRGLGVSAPMAPPPGGMPMGAAPQSDPQAGMPGGQAASPEEQRLYDTTVAAAMIALYDKAMLPKLMELFRKPGDLVSRVSDVASGLAMRVYGQAQKDGTSIPGDVMLHAGKEITEAVAEVAGHAGAPLDDQQIEQAYYQAVDRFRADAQKSGLYTNAAFQQDTATLGEMGRSGKLQAVTDMIAQSRQGGAA